MSLHYKKDGSLDMRYSSSKAAVASGASYGGGSSSSYSRPSSSSSSYCAPSASSGLHYKRDGTLDMRYNSSKAAVAASSSSYNEPLHYKRDGTLDMRYSSSKAAAAELRTAAPTPPPVPLKKDGTPDMRYKSSREYVKQMEKLSIKGKPTTAPRYAGVPSDVPVTQTGAPDLRTTRGKQWVQDQAHNWHPADPLPAWVPCLKDGSPDMGKAVSRHFIGGAVALGATNRREDYYETKCQRDQLFEEMMRLQRMQDVEMVYEPKPLPATTDLARTFTQIVEDDTEAGIVLPSCDAVHIDFANDLQVDEGEPLGKGAFGTVYLAKWKGKAVAVKKLHTTQLTKKERKMFVRETLVLSLLGEHPNIVQLFGYTLSPASLVMEYVPNGSLSYLLHYCDDPAVEAKITDGRIKLNILLGIAHGMTQLHACNVTHGDLKPQNVLLTDDFHAKIADFGLATFRAKSASTTSSHLLSATTSSSSRDDDKDTDFEGIAGGTAAYMAPELLTGSALANENTDVYSFGVLMNELLHEEEPYQQNLRQFVGKGPFAAVLFAKEGNRPRLHGDKAPGTLKIIIERCWNATPSKRPTFAEVAKLLATCQVPHACE